MSRSLTGARTRRSAAAAGAAVVAVLASASLAGSASAAFTTQQCEGDNASGRGASFAASAHNQVFIPNFNPVFCNGSGPAVTYSSVGSGAGRRVMGERTSAPGDDNSNGSKSRSYAERFGMSDEPVGPANQSDINKGTDALGDEGLMRTIPLANGAIAVAVNLPDGCTIWAKPGTTTPFTGGGGGDVSSATLFSAAEKAQISDFGNADRARLQLTRAQLEAVWNGGDELDEWGELVAWINDGNGTASEASDTRCQDHPIFRVRRLDDSGTSFAFKDYLDNLNPSRGWLSTYVTPDTRTWPNPEKVVAFDLNGNTTVDTVAKCAAQTPQFPGDGDNGKLSCTEAAIPTLQTTEVLPTAGNGNDDLINKVNDFDGSIGYGDLSTVRQQRTFAFERQPGAADDKFWVKLQTKNLAGFADPQSAPLGFLPSGARGANCLAANLSGLPTGGDATTADWSQVSAVDSSPAGYGICSLTYAIVWDDYSGPYSALPDQAAEERKARTVKDYMSNALSTLGQAGLGAFDYSPLSDSIRQVAQSGVDAIGWQKTTGGGGGGGGGGTPVTPAPTGTTTPTAPAPPAPSAPSNVFTLSKPRAAKGNILVSAQVPGAGNVRASATARIGRRTVTIASGASTRSSGGAVRFTLRPSRAAKTALRRGNLRVTVRVAYTPTGGSEATKTVTLTLRRTAAKR
jgi:ABC-type phosphate transport system substrate-binding protein